MTLYSQAYCRLASVRPRLIVTLICALVLMVSAVAPAAADEGSTRGIVLMTGIDQFTIALSGWIVPLNQTYYVEVIEPPRFGTWNQEVYRPTEAFWHFGGDRLVLSVTTGGTVSTHTLVLLAATSSRVRTVIENFELSAGGIDEPWQMVGDPNAVTVAGPAIEGALSLVVDLTNGGGAVTTTMIGPPGKGITGVDQLGGDATVNPDVPGDEGQYFPAFAEALPITILNLSDFATVEMRQYRASKRAWTEVRAVVEDAAVGCAPQCATPWRVIPTSADTKLRLWFGRELVLHPSASDATLHFEVVPPAPAVAQHDTLTGLTNYRPPALEWTAGATGGNGVGAIALDSLHGWWDEYYRRSGVRTVVDDFDGGVWGDNWQVLGPVTRVPLTALFDSHIAIDVSTVLRQQSQQAMLLDDVRLASRLRLELDLGFKLSGLAEGHQFTVWGAGENFGDVTNPDAMHPVQLQVKMIDQTPHVRVRLRADDGAVHDSAWLAADLMSRLKRNVPIVLHWWAGGVPGSAFMSKGGAFLMVDGQATQITGVDNHGFRVQEHAIGMWEPKSRNGLSSGSVREIGPQLMFDRVVLAY